MREADSGEVQIASNDSSTELVRYERGLPFVSVLRATFLRFVPGAAITVGGGIQLMGLGVSPFSLDGLVMLGGAVGILALGFSAGLELVRRWLYPDAAVDGRRSFIAGLVSPLGAFITGVLARPLTEANALASLFLPALVVALLMFFAWLSPTPKEQLGSEYESSPDLD